MGASQSIPEKLHRCAKKGEYHTLKSLLDRLQTAPEYRANPRAFLDAVDEDGNTPLIVASMRGHWQVAELLIWRGASLTAQNSRGDGGSALHEAVSRRQGHVVDLLLTNGASPFVENYKGFTAMDLACSTKNIEILRRIETYAQWSGWLSMKISRLGGLGTEWQRRWVVVCHRIPSPFAPPNRQVTHVVLLCYKSTSSCTPASRVWLDGARTTEVQNARALERTGGRSPAQLELQLHRRLRAPSGCYTTGNSREGFILHLRPDEGTEHGCEALRTWGAAVNNPRLAPMPPRPPPPPAAPAASTPQQQGQGGIPYTPPHRPSDDAHYSPLGNAVSGGGDVASADADLARRLQAEEDARLAHQLSSMPSAGLETSPSAPLSLPSQDVPGFYPNIRFNMPGGSNNNNNSRPPQPERVMAAGGPPPPSPFFAGSVLSGSVAPTAPVSSIAQRPSTGGGGGGAVGAAPAGVPATVLAAANLRAQQQAATTERCCIICLDNPIDSEFSHEHQSCAVVCAECAAAVMNATPQQTCPKCRQQILAVRRFYYG